MNWMLFRSSSAPRRDPMQRRWKLLTSKINWKKRKVRSTTQLRISQMASIFIYSAYELIFINLSVKQKLNTWGTPEVFLVQKLNSCPSSHFNNIDFWTFPPSPYHLVGIPGALVLFRQVYPIPPGSLSCASNKSGFGQVLSPVFHCGHEGLGLSFDDP